MSKYFPFSIGDEFNELVTRYEKYLSGADSGYFEVEEIGNIVDYYLLRAKISEAKNALEFGKRLHPESSLLEIKRAKIYLATGKAEKAHRVLQNLVEINDDEAQMLRLETWLKLGKDNDAYKQAENIVNEEDYEDVDTICFDLALIFMANGNFDHALQLLIKGEQANPQNIDLLFEKAFCQEQLANDQDVIKTYERIIELDAFLGEAWFNLGQVYFNGENYKKAVECYDYAIAINEEDTISLIQKAHAYFQLGNYVEAIQGYQEFASAHDEKWYARAFIGESYEKLEDFSKALFYYQLSLEEKPENYDAIVGAAICYLELERYDKSLEYIEQAMNIDDKGADVWVYLAEAKIGLDRMDEALEAYLHSLEIDPSQPDTLMAIASIYMDKGIFEDAVKFYEAAYSFDTDLEMIELFMAAAYYYTGKFEKSKEFLQRAVQKNLDAEKLFLEFCPDADFSR